MYTDPTPTRPGTAHVDNQAEQQHTAHPAHASICIPAYVYNPKLLLKDIAISII